MALAPGNRIGGYEISALIGAGGMGEVYRARDTKLNRDVALKILPEAFTLDGDRIARFRREAQVLASLNHPNIAAIYGFEDSGRTHALVLELVEGPTLADRIAQGAIPLDEALPIARQIAEALEAAHEQGIVHRDLKPANIKLRADGTVKVLDFGLAKALEPTSATNPSVTNSPTITTPAMTQMGVILGTAAYMSPEQARGKPVDKRTDIWAFGCVLYEMLTGRGGFAGETLSDTLAAILEREPNWQALPSTTPDKVQDVLRRCLQKDPQRRLRDIGDARLEIDDAIVAPRSTRTGAVATGRRSTWAWVLAGMVTAAVLWLRLQPAGDSAADLALTIAPPSASGIAPVGSFLAIPEISPDGAFVTYHDRFDMLQLRRLNAISPKPLPGTSGVANIEIWSADSKSLVFADGRTLKRMRVPDGAPEIIGRLPGPLLAGTLSDSGTLLFLSFTTKTSLFVIPQTGGEPKEIDVPGSEEGTYLAPRFLSGGEDFLFGIQPRGSQENEVYLVTWRDAKPADPVLLMKNATGYRYTPAGAGRVLFVRGGNLYGQTLNRKTRRLEGDPELMEQGVASGGATAYFSVSRSGVVAWRPGRVALPQVTVFDRQGKPIGTAGSPGFLLSLKTSPDEQHVLVAVPGAAWLLEPNQLGRNNVSQGSLTMLWSPDSSHFLVPQGSRVVERPVSGPGEGRALASAPGLDRLEDVSMDGKVALFTHGSFADAVFALRLDGTSKEPVATPVVDGRQTNELVWNTRFSPDGRWIVYQVPGPNGGIFVQPFPGPGLRKQVASGGDYPVWRKDGKEIVYLDQYRIWSVRVDTSDGAFHAATPEPLFSVRPSATRARDVSQLAVSRDGSRIYFPQAVEPPDYDVIHVRMGWQGAAGR